MDFVLFRDRKGGGVGGWSPTHWNLKKVRRTGGEAGRIYDSPFFYI
jgi:hypothetical protein